MGCFSFAANFITAHNSTQNRFHGPALLGISLLGLISCGLFVLASLLATSGQAAPQRFEPRAGSSFSGAADVYGRVTRRPYLRQPSAVAPQVNASPSKFDYRLETDAASEDASLVEYGLHDDSFDQDTVESFDQDIMEHVGYCDCGDDDCCGDGCCGDWLEPGCGCDDACEPNCGCDDSGCSCYGGGGGGTRWHAGFEWSFVKPRYSENVAFTTMESDGATASTFSDTEFDYDLELTPRVWIEAQLGSGWNWRVSYWQFDHQPAIASTSPNANGFGEITHPPFGDVDISTTIPTDTFAAASDLRVYTIDVEALKQAQFNGWLVGVGSGIRYASVEQGYLAEMRNTGNVLRGQIDYEHDFEGFGPTLSLSASKPFFRRIQLVCAARGSLLYGDSASRLIAGEDLDLANPFTTTRLTSREDLLAVGDTRAGLQWLSPKQSRYGIQWLLSAAVEGQLWGAAGNATNESADLGFVGFNVGAGFAR